MTTTTLNQRYDSARAALEQAGQGHVLQFWDRLDAAQREQLLSQIASVDWPEVARLVQTHVLHKPQFKLPENVQPAPWYPYTPPAELKAKYRDAWAAGEELVRRGQVAGFTVAGGQGTRLGWAGPKGAFPATPIRKTPLFGCLAEYLLKVMDKYGAAVPWYVMTSPINDADTRAFFAQHRYFGLNPRDVMIFPQAMMPAIGMALPGNPRAGKVLLESPASLALSPNGHGGSLKALYTSGAIADMQKRGIEQISYTQVDNPIVRIIDPIFLGLHALDQCEMSSKMLPKREPLEKLGNFCLIDGQMTVIEYSDLPDALAHERLPSGQLRFLAGSIAIHAIRVDFVRGLNERSEVSGQRSGTEGSRVQGSGQKQEGQTADRQAQIESAFSLPFHRAEKKVPYYDPARGQVVKPEQPNAVKLETFVFDALPLCQRSIIYETSRPDEFAPIKNADGPGAVDCPATSYQIQTDRAARWLEANGAKVPRREGKVDAVIEISQRTAVDAEDLQAVKLPGEIKAGAQVVL